MKRDLEQEMDSVLQEITNLAEAKRCFKIVYRKYLNCHQGARFFMCLSLFELCAILYLVFRS